MKRKKSYVNNCATLVILLLLTISSAHGQQAEETIQPVQQQAGETARPVAQQVEKKIKVEGHLLELLERKVSEEQFKNILKESKDKELSRDEFFDLLVQAGINIENIEAFLQEAEEKLKLINTVKVIAPIALAINKAETEIKNNEKELEVAQSDDLKSDIRKKIEELQGQIAASTAQIRKASLEINEAQVKQLSNILKQLEYKGEEYGIITLQIQTQVDLIKTIGTMDAIIESIDKNRAKIKEMELEQKKAQTDEEKAVIAEEMKLMGERLEALQSDFAILVTGVDKKKLFQKEEEKTDWNRELQEVFSPLIVQLKQVTERPRQIEMLRSQIGYYEGRVPLINSAVKNVENTKKNITNPKTANQLLKLEEFWKQQKKEYIGKLEAANHQLFELEKDKMSFPETMDYLFNSVLKQRGISMLYAIAAFLVTFLVFHLLRLLILKLNPLTRFPKLMFLGNLIDVLLYVLTFFAATMAMVTVLYVYGNWLIPGVVVIILIGLVWAARNTLPLFVEQIKVLLGFGAVRQGERIMYDGLPYKVESIGIFCYLKNPLLTGGTVRLPLKDLIEMRSRPYEESEPWFPCKEGDYVLIDGLSTWRKVALQTPHVVTFEWYEMFESVPTSSFVNRNIFNLSVAPFWAGINFQIAYKHRDTVLEEVCSQLSAFVEKAIKENPSYGDLLLYTWIDLGSMKDPSFSLMAWLQMKPEAARYYGGIQITLLKMCLSAANKYGWEILRFEHKVEHKPGGLLAAAEPKAIEA